MSDQLVKRMAIKELRENMVIADNIHDKTGQLILPKNTMLNEGHFASLVSNQIVSVYVVEDSIDWLKPRFEYKEDTTRKLEALQSDFTDTEEFADVEETYTETNDELKDYILAIGDGEEIPMEDFLKLTDGIMDKMKYKGEIFSYLHFLKSADEHTFSHSTNVGLLCNVFGQWLGLDDAQQEVLTISGILHDVGKTKTPPEILNKKGPLTDEEFVIMRQHALDGYRMLEPLENVPNEAKIAALTHHEKIDGSGYPLQLHNKEINPYAKIVTICDIYDAMTANRVYRDKICPFAVIRQFEQQSFGELDTRYLLVFLQNIAYNYIGSFVALSNDEVGEVVFINRMALSRPIVRCGKELIDLSEQTDIEITSVV